MSSLFQTLYKPQSSSEVIDKLTSALLQDSELGRALEGQSGPRKTFYCCHRKSGVCPDESNNHPTSGPAILFILWESIPGSPEMFETSNISKSCDPDFRSRCPQQPNFLLYLPLPLQGAPPMSLWYMDYHQQHFCAMIKWHGTP